ncbi:hypothetical protein HanIR_Chr09g0425111 [Helianthus annuus]|nr:hypothetical protein HanIR_Chr09g0425111 [Helianthus annuus]
MKKSPKSKVKQNKTVHRDKPTKAILPVICKTLNCMCLQLSSSPHPHPHPPTPHILILTPNQLTLITTFL